MGENTIGLIWLTNLSKGLQKEICVPSLKKVSQQLQPAQSASRTCTNHVYQNHSNRILGTRISAHFTVPGMDVTVMIM